MRTILKDGRRYVLRFMQGEEVAQALKEFCKQEGIKAGTFQGLGACDYLKISFYELSTKNYLEKEYKEDLEIAGITGNIAMADAEPVVHMHGTFGNREFNSISGHVKEMKVSVTCEIFLIKLEGKMNRVMDEKIGLKLLS